MADEVTITPTKNGPYYVQVRGSLAMPDGATKQETVLCRCGGSSTKPFCDGTHKKIGFTADETAPIKATLSSEA